MAKQADAPRPTDGELEILNVLWRRGVATVREVHDELGARKSTLYTTVLKTLQIMTEKGLVERDESQRAHLYRACLAQDETRQQLLDDLLARAFDNSASKLVMQALSGSEASAEELSEIRALLDSFEHSGGGKGARRGGGGK